MIAGTGANTRQERVRATDGARAHVKRRSTTTVASVVVPRPFTRDAWPFGGAFATHLLESAGRRLPRFLALFG